MVNKQRVQMWVDALRSGQFRQAREALALQSPEGDWSFCCLGVACEVAIANGLPIATRVTEVASGAIEKAYADTKAEEPVWQDMTLPEQVIQWFGLPDNNPDLNVDVDGFNLIPAAALNDKHGWDFEQIAEAIEHTYLREENADDSE